MQAELLRLLVKEDDQYPYTVWLGFTVHKGIGDQ